MLVTGFKKFQTCSKHGSPKKRSTARTPIQDLGWMILLYKFGTSSVSRNGTNCVGSPFEKRAIYVKCIGITHPKRHCNLQCLSGFRRYRASNALVPQNGAVRRIRAGSVWTPGGWDVGGASSTVPIGGEGWYAKNHGLTVANKCL